MTGVRGQGARADFFGDGVAVGESCLETVELGAHEGLRYGPERRFPRPFDARGYPRWSSVSATAWFCLRTARTGR